MNILITGRPGTGKTTLIKEIFQKTGKRAGGFYTEEIRKERQRRGFKIRTLDGKTGILSGIDIDSPYRVGKYRVNLPDFERIALTAVENALESSEIIIIDEIGPMELFSQKFKNLVLKALDSPNHVIATIKLKGARFIDKIKSRSDVIIFNLDSSNKEDILRSILEAIDEDR